MRRENQTGLIIAVAAVLCVSIGFVGCGDNDPTGPSDKIRARWEAVNTGDYVITQIQNCPCPFGGQPMEITVDDDTITSTFNVALDRALTIEEARPYKTIDQLFDWIDDVQRTEPDILNVIYDSTMGYPTFIFVDPDMGIVDEEIGYHTELIEFTSR